MTPSRSATTADYQKVVLYELTGQMLWRSTGSICADCGTDIPSSAEDGRFFTDSDGGHICSACWEDYNDRSYSTWRSTSTAKQSTSP